MEDEDIPDFYVVLVEPKYSGNVGAVARSMMNFDFKKLIIVNPACNLDGECYIRAVHASKILDDAEIVDCFDDAVKKLDYLVATSAIEYKNDKKHLREPMPLKDFSEKIFETEGKIGLMFGREDYGLLNEEIASCDVMLKIPTDDGYKSLNLSHAVTIVLYSLFLNRHVSCEKREIDGVEKEKLYSFFSELLSVINYPDHKRENTEVMFRRLIGRSMPSKWDYHTFMGVLSKSIENIKKK